MTKLFFQQMFYFKDKNKNGGHCISRRMKRNIGLDPFFCTFPEFLLLILFYKCLWQLVVKPATPVEEASS